MHFKGHADNFPYSGSRFQTTYGLSYNKSYTNPIKPNFAKLPESNIMSNINEIKSKSEPNNYAAPKLTPKANSDTPVKTFGPSITNRQMKDIPPISSMPAKVENIRQYDYNHMVTQIAKITDHLFLSGLHAITYDRLKSLGITLVISLIAESSVLRLPSGIERIQVNVEDTEDANIRRYFERILEQMNLEERRQGRILVHCVAGISRSSTVVLAYLMRYHNMKLRDAYNLVHSQRPYIQPNLGFWRQLIDYEKSIFGTASVNMVPADGSRMLVPDVIPSVLSEILASTPMFRVQSRFPVRSGYRAF